MAILSSILGEVVGWVGGIFKSKARIREAQANAEIARLEREAKVEADWDVEAMRAARHSWKDEWFTILLSAPFVAVFGAVFFFPEGIPLLQEAFAILASLPLWYQASFMGAIAASFGLRWWFRSTTLNKVGMKTKDE